MELGKRFSQKLEVNALMDLVILKNIFVSVNSPLIGKKDAKIITTDSSTVDVA